MIKKYYFLLFISVLVGLSSAIPSSYVSAVKDPGFLSSVTAPITTVGDASGGIIGLFCSIARWWLAFTMLLSIVIGIWGGWKMVQKGEKGLNEEARHMIQYSLVGVAVGIAALGVPKIAADFFDITNIGKLCSFLP